MSQVRERKTKIKFYLGNLTIRVSLTDLDVEGSALLTGSPMVCEHAVWNPPRSAYCFLVAVVITVMELGLL